MPYKILIILLLMFAIISNSADVSGQNAFNYEEILADSELTNYQTMDEGAIQRFLESKGSYLSTYFVTLDTGERISAARHIYLTSQKHRVNPQFLLALIQKEQSLIESATPKPTQLDWAAGYGCFDGSPCNERWRGFHKQINSAAEQFRYYYENIHEYNFRPGKTSVIDGQAVTPKNILTAALYNYTPHLHGNRLFRTLWDRYFIKQVPDGTLVQATGEAGVWLLEGGLRRAFISRLALTSRYNPNLIVNISKSDLEQYPRGNDIAFPAYSLLQGTPSSKIYLLTVNDKRHIASMDVFRQLGFNPEEVEEVADAELASIPEGRAITLSDSHPTGTLMKDQSSGDLYYIELGRKYKVLAPDIATVNFPSIKIATVANDALQKYSSGLPIKLKDGVLVKGSGSEVYVISNQKRRHIATEQVFNAVGYNWKNIVTVSDSALNLHEVGEPLSVQ